MHLGSQKESEQVSFFEVIVPRPVLNAKILTKGFAGAGRVGYLPQTWCITLPEYNILYS
jgi:hypothetical protein